MRLPFIVIAQGGGYVSMQSRFFRANYVINCAGLYSGVNFLLDLQPYSLAAHVVAVVGANNFSVHPHKGEYLVLNKNYIVNTSRELVPDFDITRPLHHSPAFEQRASILVF